MLLGAKAINNFPSEMGKAGIVIFSQNHFKEGFVTALCSRNLAFALNKLDKLNSRILYKFNTNTRDIEGKRIFRYLKKNLNVISGNETTITFTLNNKDFFEDLNKNPNVLNPKILVQRLKAYLRQAITSFGVSREITVKDILIKTFPVIDGLQINQLLTWLADEGFIRIFKNRIDFFQSKIRLK